MERNQFTWYRSYYEALRYLPAKEFKEAVLAICAYALDEETAKLSGVTNAIFCLVKPTLDSGRNKAANRNNKSKQANNAEEQTDNKTATAKNKRRTNAEQAGTIEEQTDNKPEQIGNTQEQTRKEKEGEREEEREKENDMLKKTHLLTEMSKRNPANAAPEAGTNALSPAARAVIADYLDRVNPSASETSLRMLASYADAMGEAVCKRALDVALDEHKATWSYIRAILQAKMSAGVKSLADWDRSEQQRSSGKQENSRPSKPTTGPGPAAMTGPSAQDVRDSQAWMRELLAMDKARKAPEGAKNGA